MKEQEYRKAVHEQFEAQQVVNKETRDTLATLVMALNSLSAVVDATLKALKEKGIEVDVPEVARKDPKNETDG
jgi:hypothetical protein